jgi:hypothetical protein
MEILEKLFCKGSHVYITIIFTTASPHCSHYKYFRMKWFILLFLTFSFAALGCDTQKQENALQLREAKLKEKEQEVLLREQTVQLKEAELLERLKLLDSLTNPNVADTLSTLHAPLPGVYNVTMKCTETNCTGSAVGDTKIEQWELSFENNLVIVKAMSEKKLLRIYKGSYTGSAIELTAQQDNLNTPQAGSMIVRLQETKDNGLDGTREITRPDNCRITYDLDLQKQ